MSKLGISLHYSTFLVSCSIFFYSQTTLFYFLTIFKKNSSPEFILYLNRQYGCLNPLLNTSLETQGNEMDLIRALMKTIL